MMTKTRLDSSDADTVISGAMAHATAIRVLVHNENNMRPSQLNSIFSICDLKDVCSKISKRPDLSDYCDEEDFGKVHGMLLTRLNDFMEMQNNIAHSLNLGSSPQPNSLLDDILFFKALALSLSETLPIHLPPNID
jgi:hypothetical protein